MTGLDPDALGWTEFWLRIGILMFALTVVVLAAAMAVRLILDVKAGLGWIMRKVRRDEAR